MKNRIYSTFLAAIIALPANLFASELSLGTQNNQKFTLGFDNAFYSTPSNTYNVTNVLPGNHHIRMTSVPMGMNGACALPQLLFDGWVNIPQNARLTAYPLNFSQMNIVSIVPLYQQYYNPYDPYDYTNGYGNMGENIYGNGCGNPSYPNNNYGYGTNYPPVNYGMSSSDFAAFKNSVNAQSFDSNKLAVAEQGVAANQLTSVQVKELIALMTFESSKLDLAKFAYGHTLDRNNYYQVNDAFIFSSSVDELSGYINTYH